MGLGVGQGHAGELDRPLHHKTGVELDVAELEVAAAPWRVWRDAALPHEASPQSHVSYLRAASHSRHLPVIGSLGVQRHEQ